MDQTPNGIDYEWWATGPQGARFELFPRPEHTEDDIQEARGYLMREHDVVSLKVSRVSS